MNERAAVAQPKALAEVLRRLATGEARHRVAVDVDEPAHPRRVDLGVLAQGPADRLADEELGVARLGTTQAASRSGSVSDLAPTWWMIALRRRHWSASTAHARIVTSTVERWARWIGPMRWMAIVSTWSHQAPVTTMCS